MTILQWILKILMDNHGKIEGTDHLCQMIPANPVDVKQVLTVTRRKGLVTSIRTHGGRGHRSVHNITRKGMEYANRL
jgi:DNA-binding PadR family transcriptional regulator